MSCFSAAVVVAGDLGDLDSNGGLLDLVFCAVPVVAKGIPYSRALLINNAGTVGDLTKQVKDYSDINGTVL